MMRPGPVQPTDFVKILPMVTNEPDCPEFEHLTEIPPTRPNESYHHHKICLGNLMKEVAY